MTEQTVKQYPYRVLVIDDSAHVRILVSKFLKTIGFVNIETAENGRFGLEKIKSFKPHIVILDGIMPEVDGLTVLKEVKKDHEGVYVVISSSLSEREKILEFKEAGADSYILKPFEQDKFFETIKKVIAMVEAKEKAAS